MIVGATVTHNTSQEDLKRAIRSLRSCCDVVLSFDDASTDDTVSRSRALTDSTFAGIMPYPHLLTLRRAMLFAEAQRLKATWFVYHDDDEELSPSLQASLRGVLTELEANPEIQHVQAGVIHFWGDLDHRVTKPNVNVPNEVVAWRANGTLTYYYDLALMAAHLSPLAAWHAPRAPQYATGYQLQFPWAALLHYGNCTPERTSERRRWSLASKLTNELDRPPADGEVVEIGPDRPWDQP